MPTGKNMTVAQLKTALTNGSVTQAARVVTILLAEKGADQKKVTEMSLESKFEFKERKVIAGVPAYESVPLPDQEHHSLDLLPKPGTYVQIVAYKGGPGWENAENRHAVVSAFAGKVDLKKLAALE